MTLHYRDDAIELHHGDSLPLLAAMASESVDAVVTDPPYSSGGAFRADRTGSGTTGVAAINQGRRAILCEIGAEGAEVARNRIEVHRSAGADMSSVGADDVLPYGEPA